MGGAAVNISIFNAEGDGATYVTDHHTALSSYSRRASRLSSSGPSLLLPPLACDYVSYEGQTG